MIGLKRKQEQFCDLYPADAAAALDIAIAQAMRERYHRGAGNSNSTSRRAYQDQPASSDDYLRSTNHESEVRSAALLRSKRMSEEKVRKVGGSRAKNTDIAGLDPQHRKSLDDSRECSINRATTVGYVYNFQSDAR
ncbi:hypothetical protein LRP30_33130 [Bradyrhizobium sp. C-145]|uniref:hypothetical protein n=1 Tax=Bradyrhizobium sp. C-145 TaxID=574727 RepID=UPI00201B7CB6|nr:hypothetical protein [Bradyrhizobium sp. C-145]UQR61630.1 hypothetical protein LRP30_33130 [Bradyrhizobium sp. C-145]